MQYKARTGQMIQCSILGPSAPSISIPSAQASTSAQAVASSSTAAITNSSLVPSVNIDTLFDSSIADEDLIGVIDQASQSLEQERLVVRENNNVVLDASSGYESSVVLNQSSTLNAVLTRSIKSVNFERTNNCTFNFYLSK